MPHDPDFHPHWTLNYTVTALLGVLAGFIVGYVYGHPQPALDDGNSSNRPSALAP